MQQISGERLQDHWSSCVDDLMDAVWSLRTTFKTVKEAKAQLIRPAVSIPGYTTDKVNKVDKEEAVKYFRSRFSYK